MNIHPSLAPLPGKVSKKAIFSWCLFDWANSAFPTVVTTFVFASYFTETLAPNRFEGTKQWGYMMALSGFLIALLSPLFGAVADYSGRRKPWLVIFTAMAAVGSVLLWYAVPGNTACMTLGLVFLGMLGFELGTVFYNAMLSELAPKKYLGRISGWAWGFGYLGGVACLAVALIFFIKDSFSLFSFDRETFEHIRAVGPLVGFWFVLFGLPLFLFTPDRPSTGLPLRKSIREGTKTLFKTLKTLPKHRQILLFLIANMLYMDGLNTIFAFGGIYAAGSFGFSMEEILILGIAMNVVAGVGAALFGWIDDYFGAKITILLSLMIILISGFGLIIVTIKVHFWVLGLILSVSVGSVQAASRSMMVRLSPPAVVTEMFGLFALSGRVTAFVGPLLLGGITAGYASQRIGMIAILFFILMGLVILTYVEEPLKRPARW